MELGSIHDAAANGDLDTVKKILEQNPSLVNQDDQYEWRPIFHAGLRRRYDVVKSLFEKSFDTVSHQVNGSNVDHRLRRLSRAFIIQSQSAKPTEPGKGALHNPTQWDNHKSRSTQR